MSTTRTAARAESIASGSGFASTVIRGPDAMSRLLDGSELLAAARIVEAGPEHMGVRPGTTSLSAWSASDRPAAARHEVFVTLCPLPALPPAPVGCGAALLGASRRITSSDDRWPRHDAAPARRTRYLSHRWLDAAHARSNRTKAKVMKTVWTSQEFTDEDLSLRDLAGADMRSCRFTRCSFRHAKLSEVSTQSCTFVECAFQNAKMNISRHEVSAFLNCRFDLANLFGAKFIECKLTGSHLQEAILTGVTVESGDWSYVNMRMQDLRTLDLRRVNLSNADLYECNLEKADLRDADLSSADLRKARIVGADLRGAKVDGVDLKSLNLRRVRLTLGQAVYLARSHGAEVEDFE
jgi:uncharacterized protein YjbI with pentapeptide repeats